MAEKLLFQCLYKQSVNLKYYKHCIVYLDPDKNSMTDAETFDKRFVLIIKSSSLMLNYRVVLTLALKKMLYDNSRKMGNAVPSAPAFCTK